VTASNTTPKIILFIVLIQTNDDGISDHVAV